MRKTRLAELLGIQYPIIQGGLAYLALADLCAAVSNAGGLGQITAATVGGPEELRREIRRVRELTTRPFGMNFAIGHRPLEALIDVTLEEGVGIVTITGGNPEPLMRYIDQRVPGVKKIILTAGVRTAQKAEALGADAVIAVGYDGGGHLGRDDTGTLALVPRVVEAVRIPVAASGGIVDGRGLVAALALGAEGIEMGTRFVVTRECVAHPAYKAAILRSEPTDTVIIERSLGRPGRALDTAGARTVLAAEQRGATLEEMLSLVSGAVNRKGALDGHLDDGFVWAGQGIGLIRDEPTVAELFRRLLDEARTAAGRLHGLLA